MKDQNKLAASLAVFKELYENKMDVYDILAEFIKATIVENNIWSFIPSQLNQSLKEQFNFEIPEAVVSSTIKNRIKKKNIVSLVQGQYVVNKEELNKNSNFTDRLKNNEKNQIGILESLIEFVEFAKANELANEEKQELKNQFFNYLLDEKSHEEYSKLISSFIVQNSSNADFLKQLNSIKEGTVIYTGIRYTPNLNELGSWKKPMVIFLDTEHLFNVLGFNGEVYQQLIDDFISLVQDINRSSKTKPGNLIELKYFDETKEEVEKFFYVSQLVVEQKISLDPSKSAMVEIVKGCSSKSDIIEKKVKFWGLLKLKGIKEEDEFDYYEKQQYNLVDKKSIKSIGKKVTKRGYTFNAEECSKFLKIFTKINVLRRGNSNCNFNDVKFIFLTGNKFCQYLTYQEEVKLNEKDIPYSTAVDFITDRFWFSLKKGFGKNSKNPISFNVATKAKIILSDQINSSISARFESLKQKINSGDISKEDAIAYNYELREHTSKPEEISDQNLDSKLAFLSEEGIDKYLDERAKMRVKISEGEKAKEELQSLKKQNYIKQRIEKKKKVSLSIKKKDFMYSLLTILLFGVLSYLIFFLENGDSILSIIFGVITILALIVTIIKLKDLKRFRKNYIKKSVLKFMN